MTTENMIGMAIAAMIAVIGYFLKSLIGETRQTRETTLEMHTTLKGATEAIIALQQADKEHSKQILNIVERLVRIEERTQNAMAPQPPVRRVRAGK